MQTGLNWSGPYSRFSFNESKNFIMMLKEKGVPVLDDEFNISQEILLTLLRRLEHYTLGDGSADTGFKPVGTNATNDFTIKGGTYFLDGWYLTLPSDITYTTQPVTQSALTAPVANRTDLIYLDVWYDEINVSEDSSIKDPTLNIDTSHRLKLFWTVKVIQGGSVPPNYTDSNNLPHWTQQIGHIFRTNTTTITPPMINDDRRIILGTVASSSSSSIGQVAFFAGNTAPTGWLVCDGTNVSRTTYASLFAYIGTIYGVGDGSTTFGLPKMNDGKFLRAWNNTGAGRDAGRTFGSTASDTMISHSHITAYGENSFLQNPNAGRPNPTPWGVGPFPYDSANVGAGVGFQSSPPAGWIGVSDWDQGLPMSSPPCTVTPAILMPTATETAPYNIALLCCIRYS